MVKEGQSCHHTIDVRGLDEVIEREQLAPISDLM